MKFCARVLGVAGLVCAGLGFRPVTSAQSPDPTQFVELGHHYPAYEFAYNTRFASKDVDGDSLPDFVFAAKNGQSSLLNVIGKQDGSVGIKQSALLPFVPQATYDRILRVLAGSSTPPDGSVYVVTYTGEVAVYGDWPLKLLRTFSAFSSSHSVYAAASGDINVDGHDELVLLAFGSNGTGLYVFSIESGALLWQYDLGTWSQDIALVNLDADPALEIVAGADILDGATGALDGSRATAFGEILVHGNFDSDDASELAALEVPGAGRVDVFDGVPPWNVIWQYPTGGEITALSKFDFDDDGRDELIVAKEDTVHIVDSVTHQDRFAVSSYTREPIASVVAGDLDGDGSAAICAADRSPSSGIGAQLHIFDSSTGFEDLTIQSEVGHFGTVVLGDIGGDGDLDQVVASSAARNSSSIHTSVVYLLDAQTGAITWQSGPDYAATPQMDINDIALGHMGPGGVGSGGPLDIVLGGGSPTSSEVVRVIDGSTHQVKLQIDVPWDVSHPLFDRSVFAIQLLDANQDSTTDIAAASLACCASDVKVVLLSGVDGSVLATSSVYEDSSDERFVDLLLTGAQDDPAAGLVLVAPEGIHGLDRHTLQQTWTVPIAAIGGRYLPHGPNGPELMVFDEDGVVSFLDGTTHQVLRTITVPSPLAAMVALRGDPSLLLVAAQDKLQLISGSDGHVMASSPSLGTYLGYGNQLAAFQTGTGSWQIAVGSDAGYYRYQLSLSDSLFGNGFESP